MNDEMNVIVQFPVFIQLYVQKQLILFQIETVLLPIVTLNEKANSYIKLQVVKPYIDLNEEIHISIVHEELKNC